MIALAAQRYGIIVRDQSHEDIGFFAEDPTQYGDKPYTASDPYYGVMRDANGAPDPVHGRPDPNALFDGMWPSQFFRYFPWRSLAGPKDVPSPRQLTAALQAAAGPRLYCRRVRRRVAFVDYFCPHYRRPLFEELARRMEMDFYFFSDARDKWWNSRLPTIEDGDFRRIALRRYRIAGEPFVPSLPLRLSPTATTPSSRTSTAGSCCPRCTAPRVSAGAVRAVDGNVVSPADRISPPHASDHRGALPRRARDRGLRRARQARAARGPGVSREKIFVAGQAVDASRFADVQPARDGRPVVLFVGQFEERKGIDDLLAAFERVTDPVAELRLVGNGSLEEQIRRRIDGSSRVTIVGHVPQDDLPAELERATCLVLPSVTTRETNEPWGLVVNEAMHAGLPVVATDAVGAAAGGLVRDGQNGYVVPERNPDSSPTRSAPARRPGSAARMGRQARVDAAEFNYDRMADAFQGAVEYAVEHGWK